MTAADKLRELLATRPAKPSGHDLERWWQLGGDVILRLLADVEAIDCDLVAERAELRRERDARAQLRVEIDRERLQYKAELAEAKMLARDAQIQAMDRGASFQAVTAELESLRPVLKEALDNWYKYVADIANTPSSRIDSGNAEHVSWAKRECERIVELSRMTTSKGPS